MQEIRALIELLTMLMTDPRSGVLIVLLVIAAISDYRSYRIPNWLTFGGAMFALIYAAVVPFARDEGFLWAVGGLLLGFGVALPLYVLRAMGAGDVKLIAMSGAFLGMPDIVYAVLCTFIVGGVAALGFAFSKRVAGRMFSNIMNSVQVMLVSVIGRMTPSAHIDSSASVGRMPYGVSIAIGTIGYVVAKQLGYL